MRTLVLHGRAARYLVVEIRPLMTAPIGGPRQPSCAPTRRSGHAPAALGPGQGSRTGAPMPRNPPRNYPYSPPSGQETVAAPLETIGKCRL